MTLNTDVNSTEMQTHALERRRFGAYRVPVLCWFYRVQASLDAPWQASVARLRSPGPLTGQEVERLLLGAETSRLGSTTATQEQ